MPDADLGLGLGSSAIAGVDVSVLKLGSPPPGTPLMIGLIPAVLSVLLLETLHPDVERELDFEMGVGGTELSSLRSKAALTAERNPDDG